MFCDTSSLVPFLTFTFKQTLEHQCFWSFLWTNLLFGSWSLQFCIHQKACCSLIPRPFHLHLFDCLQYGNTVSQTLDAGYRNNHWNTSPSGDTQMCMSLHSACQYVLPPFLSAVGEHLPYLVVLFDHCTGDWRYNNWPYMVCQPLLPPGRHIEPWPNNQTTTHFRT